MSQQLSDLTLITIWRINMKNTNTLVSTALASIIALGIVGMQSASAEDKKDVEKCYGVAKAGKNDCKTMSNACAGHSTADAQPDAFIALPKGTCERIAGGSLEVPAK
jgi:uncharacterized membrane protein